MKDLQRAWAKVLGEYNQHYGEHSGDWGDRGEAVRAQDSSADRSLEQQIACARCHDSAFLSHQNYCSQCGLASKKRLEILVKAERSKCDAIEMEWAKLMGQYLQIYGMHPQGQAPS